MIMHSTKLTRREFGAAAGALIVSFALAPQVAVGQAARLPGSLANNTMLDAWLRINADGSATIFTGKVELGQGILTALAQIAAEELDLPLAHVAIISGDTARTPDEGHTSGSQSIENGGTAIRLASAEARAILFDRAAKQLGVAADTLSVVDGIISAREVASSVMASLWPGLISTAKRAPRRRQSRPRNIRSSASRHRAVIFLPRSLVASPMSRTSVSPA